jgi:mono/diheme cytochrome c family protein
MILTFFLAAETHAAGLKWDALEKRHIAEPGEEEAKLTFSVTNEMDHPVEIRSTATSCSCTVATPPRKPWLIAPGGTETLQVTVDLRNRRGGLSKTVYVDTSEGEQMLLVHVQIPPPPEVRREMNLITAQADRQAVLRGDCASCHVAPTVGKKGAELFQTACGICHTAEHRASMVPDLALAKVARDAAYWNKWIREGGEGTLMPAFDQAHEGSLDNEQIQSLVTYLLEHLPTQPATKN